MTTTHSHPPLCSVAYEKLIFSLDISQESEGPARASTSAQTRGSLLDFSPSLPSEKEAVKCSNVLLAGWCSFAVGLQRGESHIYRTLQLGHCFQWEGYMWI